jgi:hypothetical protein
VSAPWRDVRPADLACAASASVKPEWPRRLLAISHRSAEVKPVQTSDAVKVSSCAGKFLVLGGEGDGLVVVLAGDQAVVEAAEEAAEQVALGGVVLVAFVFAAVVVGAGGTSPKHTATSRSTDPLPCCNGIQSTC